MRDLLELLGAGILRALVVIRAGLVIAAAAFLQLSIAAANQAQILSDPLRTFFTGLSIAFGCAAFITAVLFLAEQLISVFRSRSK